MEALVQYAPLVLVVVGLVYFAYRDYTNRKAVDVKPAKTESLKIAVPQPSTASLPGPEVSDVEKEVNKAKVALDTAGIKGKERLDTIAAVRRNEVTGDEVVEAHKK